MTLKLLHPRPWDQIERLASRQAAYVAVPFIGKGAAKLLPIPKDSVLITRFSETAVKAGQVDPREIAKFIERKVNVFECNDLHAKVYVFGDTCFIGSANASKSSMGLIEACIECDDAHIVHDARKMVAAMARYPLTLEYVKSLAHLYPGERPFGTAWDGTRTDRRTSRSANGSKPTGAERAGVWVTPLYRLEWDEATNAVDKIESTKAIKKIDVSEHTVVRVNWDRKPAFTEGQWIVCRNDTKPGSFMLEPPARVISIRHVSRTSGYLVYAERPKGLRSRSAAAVSKSLGDASNAVLYKGHRDRFVRKQGTADALLGMWSAFSVR